MTLLFTACSDSFFNLYPTDEIPSTQFYKTRSDFNTATMAAYAKLTGQVSYYTELCEYRSDNYFLSAPTTSTQDRYDIDQFVDRASNGILESLWANFNNGIFRCNIMLDKIDGANFDQKYKDQYKGEALFIRALTHFNMYRVWGAVPVTLKVISPAEALKVGRSTPEQMLQYMVDDLKAAAGLLPDSYSGSDLGRATSGAASALLGKVYLTFHMWEEARDVLSPLIGKYKLQDTPAQVFDVNNELNSEIIFAVRFSKKIVGQGHGFWYTTVNINEPSMMSEELRKCYTDPKDKRKALIEYVKSGTTNVVAKFYDEQDPVTNNVGNDQILLRYADVLLMYAEALNEIGYSADQESAALTALNEVHKRSGMDKILISSLPDRESFRRAILLERQQEFPMEGHRWFDLLRMGYAKEVMGKIGYEIKDFQFIYPIPKTELERINNTSLLWQNPGY